MQHAKDRWGLLIAAGFVAIGIGVLAPIAATGQSEEQEAADRMVESVRPHLPELGTVVARVNGQTISLGRLNATYEGVGLTKEQALDQLIDYELMYQEGLRLGMAPSTSEVDEAIEQCRALVPEEAVEAAIQLSQEWGSDISSPDDYWASEPVIEGIRKSITVGNLRAAIIEEAGVEPGAPQDEAVAERVAKLRAQADIEIYDELLGE